LGAIYYGVFGFLDAMVMPEMKQELYFIRFFVVIPAILLLIILSFTPKFKKWWQLAAVLATVISGVGIVIMTIITPELGRQNYYPGIMLVLFYCYMLIRLRFIWASFSGWLIFIAYLLSAVFFPGVGKNIVITNTFFLGSANLLGMFGSYALEYYARSDFFSRYLLQEERQKVEEANLELEGKVKEKTKELQQDIQHRKKVEKELRIAKNRAEESNRLKSAFLLNLSHEIRTPLNGIFGFTDLLQSPDLTGEQQKEFIGLIQESGNRMLETVTNLVETSRIETGQVNLSFREINISEEINKYCKPFAEKAKNKGLDFVVENNLSAQSSMITDREKFQIIFSKIIGNAIKYTTNGKVVVNITQNADQLICSVTDTGIGIPKNRQKAVFERFVQADIGDKRAFEGTGLGLSIAKVYIEMLGGEIELESEEGEGSRFQITLPLKNHLPAKQEYVQDKTKHSGKHKTNNLSLLIAEDDETSQLYLDALLHKKFKNIRIANNGKEAFEMCKANKEIDVVFMDLKMPVMDGYEATRKIREFNSDIIIIAQTAYALDGDKEKAMRAGCNDYITKPIKNETLQKVLEKYL
jgi:signal transduction histidine kinase/CheY-like chemotaxis protein